MILYKIPVDMETTSAGYSAFNLNQITDINDRSVAIIGNDLIKYQIAILLEKIMIADDGYNTSFFRENSLFSNLNICYRLGLFDKEDLELVLIFPKFRNKFAHEFKIDNLHDLKLKNVADSFMSLIEKIQNIKSYGELESLLIEHKEHLNFPDNISIGNYNVYESNIGILPVNPKIRFKFRLIILLTITLITEYTQQIKPNSISFKLEEKNK